MSVRHFDQSTWLAKRALEIGAAGPLPEPPFVALPGARAAISTDRLHAYQEVGHSQHEILRRVNARWAQENREAMEAHQAWRGYYRSALEEMRRRAAEEAAKELRKRALFERFMLGLENGPEDGE